MLVAFDQRKVNIWGHHSRLFTSSWPGWVLDLAGTVFRLVGRAELALRLNLPLALFGSG